LALDVNAVVWFQTLLLQPATKCRRTQPVARHVECFSDCHDHRGDRDLRELVFRQWRHDLQFPVVIREADRTIADFLEKVFVEFPAHTVQDDVLHVIERPIAAPRGGATRL